ncbi:chemotaxis protein CheA [Candidatus Nitronereus thalassa]|uniref:histidine kinase n=1 Tax=Candidatus Nitronereus thalassa TaxID=3020898 RepID=A0ABU3K697_9BACT|nr:chemotaxis protein CheA [Candidatus Nitronereus thalassa]MDT7041878.1 chemotaxis protein CheA [Candidatus Nitronereus thalassa]
MNEEMKEILGDFLAESAEMLESLDQHFVTLESDPGNVELLNEIFRAMHSMKGGAGFLGFSHLVEVAHNAESLMNKLRNGEMAATSHVVDIILETVDIIKLLQEDIRSTGEDTHVDTDLIVTKLTLTMDSAADIGASSASSVPEAPSASTAEEPIAEESDVLEATPSATSDPEPPVVQAPKENKESSSIPKPPAIPHAVEFAASQSSNPSEVPPATPPAAPALSEMLAKMSEATTRTMEHAGKTQPKPSTREEDQSVRVETRRLDHVMNLVGELVLGRNRLMKLGGGLEERYENDTLVRELGVTLAQINLVASDLQLAVMKTRMVPIRKVFAKFPRLVRDLAHKLGKTVHLEMAGEDTEVDKSVADELGDPLVHLVRNSIDHAIELGSERKAAGKHPEGNVRLSASQEGNSIVIRIEDDGRGLQVEKIKEKALSKGLVTESDLAGMDKRDAMNLIFLPGFSTADVVSDVSGRGVGMDVVRTNISRMNGSIELNSEPGHGCLVTIKLPLTVAIIQALLVEVECSTFAIPLASVVEAVKVTKEDFKTINGRSVLNLRERILPLVRLADEFGIPSMDEAEESYVVVVAVGERRLGIVVDRLRAQEEVVIKSLGEYLSEVAGVAGATITGDGKVVLILDMADMVQKVGTLGGSGLAMVG